MKLTVTITDDQDSTVQITYPRFELPTMNDISTHYGYCERCKQGVLVDNLCDIQGQMICVNCISAALF